jgi:hypothetical protein
VKRVHNLFLLIVVLDISKLVLDLHCLPPLLIADALLKKVFVLELVDTSLHLKLFLIALVLC